MKKVGKPKEPVKTRSGKKYDLGPPIVCPFDLNDLLARRGEEIEEAGYVSEDDIELEGDAPHDSDEESDLTPLEDSEEEGECIAANVGNVFVIFSSFSNCKGRR